jgi:hypothetical protein
MRSDILVNSLKTDFPWVKFIEDSICKWSPDTGSVHYRPLKDRKDTWALLHELSHAILGHFSFDRDIELIGKEVEAWQHARDKLAPLYKLAIPDENIDSELETYREWLHSRSSCPVCELNGIQTETDTYRCLNCRTSWRVNDARRCELRRYTIKPLK